MRIFRKLLLEKTNSNLLLLFRYFFVAAAAFAVDFSGLIFLKEVAHFNYLLAATCSFCAGVVVNFCLSRGWIFSNSKLQKSHHEFIAVLAIASLGLLINDALIWLLTSAFGVFYIYSKLVASAVVFFWNFFVRKWLLYYGASDVSTPLVKTPH